MHRLTTLVLVTAVLLGGLVAPAAAGPATTTEPGGEEATRYLVRLRDTVDAQSYARSLEQSSDDADIDQVYGEVFEGFAGELPADDVAALRRDPRVLSIEPDGVMAIANPQRARIRASKAVRATIRNPRATQVSPPWGLDRIDQRALPLSGTFTPARVGRGVTAYVVDTGVRPDHEQLRGRVLPGYSSIDDGRGTADCHGHGTHVAGIVGGTTSGVAKGVALRPVRVLDCAGRGSESTVIAGLEWIITHHAPGTPAVANVSLGGAPSDAVDQAVQAVIDAGVTVAVAAGNSASPACNESPARVPAAVTVAASTSGDARASFSNHGSCVDLFAPGDQVLSAWHTSTTATSVQRGTSMAAPHVAGAAALILDHRPGLTPAQVTAQLRSTATSGVISGRGSGTPDRLLHVPPGAMQRPATGGRKAPSSAR